MDDAPDIRSPVCLTIAGFDPSGGAGVIADCRAFVALGCTPAAAITSLTFQNDRAVFGATHQSPEVIREQVNAIITESPIAAVKTGMLPTAAIIREIAQLFRQKQLPAPVIDPVLRSTSGFQLIETDAIDVLLKDLMPLARVITPNIPEAEQLTGLRIEDENGMSAAARKLREMGARAVLIKGGHLEEWSAGSAHSAERKAIDVLDDEGCVTVFRSEWIEAPSVRGTGCMLSAAIAACLGKGMKLEESIGAARGYVSDIIRNAMKSQLRTQNS